MNNYNARRALFWFLRIGTYQDTPPLIVQTNGPWQVVGNFLSIKITSKSIRQFFVQRVKKEEKICQKVLEGVTAN